MPKGKEVEVGSSNISVGDNIVTKKPTYQGKTGQNIVQNKKGSTPKNDEQMGKKDNSPVQEAQGSGDTMIQETPSETNPQEIGPPK
jgi:hypothetical protein